MSAPVGRRVVLVPIDDYCQMLERLAVAPKVGKYNPLSAKQKAKVQRQLDEACVVIMVSPLLLVSQSGNEHAQLFLYCTHLRAAYRVAYCKQQDCLFQRLECGVAPRFDVVVLPRLIHRPKNDVEVEVVATHQINGCVGRALRLFARPSVHLQLQKMHCGVKPQMHLPRAMHLRRRMLRSLLSHTKWSMSIHAAL